MEEQQNEEITTPSQEETLDLSYGNNKEVVKGGVLGFFIGLAIIVPGVSGSAIAIIFKLYEKLLYALGNIFKQFKRCVMFLLPILIGLVIGVVLGFFGVKELLNVLPFTTVALFAGLMAGSYPAVTEEIKGVKPKPHYIALFIVGLAVPILISVLSATLSEGSKTLTDLNVGHYILFLVLGYAVAITQLVPGLSATALLMAFGYFTPIINSVSMTYWGENPAVFIVYACLAVGFLIGIVSFSKVLTFIMNKARKGMFFTVCGLSLGSIISMFVNSDTFAVYNSWASEGVAVLDLVLGIVLGLAGIALAYVFVRYERKKNQEKAEKEIAA